jgi:putative ABC transport system substrate-binding protein
MKLAKLTLLMLLIVSTTSVATVYALQTPKKFVIGYLTVAPDVFKAEMTKLGYVEGETIEYKALSFENVKPEDFPMAAQTQTKAIIESGADVFVTTTDTEAVQLLTQASKSPIVFTISDDPVATGAVKSLLHPGGNITGVVTNKPNERRLQQLLEIKPTTKKVYYLYTTEFNDAKSRLEQVQASSKQLNIELVLGPVKDRQEAFDALKQMPEDVDWIYLTPFLPLDPVYEQALLDVSKSRRIPISGYGNFPIRSWATGYGPDLLVANQQAAGMVDRILRGAPPADLPVETAENYLIVNLDTMKAIELPITEEFLRQAQVIIHVGDFEKTPTPMPAPSGN